MSSEVILPGRSVKEVGEVLHSLVYLCRDSRKSRPSWINEYMLKNWLLQPVMSMVLFQLVIGSWSTQSCPYPPRCCRLKRQGLNPTRTFRQT